MKKLIAAAIAMLMVAALVFPASALEPGYTYECAKLYYPVTVDGVVTGTEWDDANALVVNADNVTVKEYGRWQGGGHPEPASDLSVTYKFKWDETNLYILEQRYDAHFIMAGDETAGVEPWNGDGTLMFLAYNSSGTYLFADAYEPFWAMSENGEMSFALRSWLSGSFTSNQEGMENWKGAGQYDAGAKMLTVELTVPFSDIGNASGSKAVAVGANLRFTAVIPNLDTADDYKTFSGTWDQLNFHDRFGRDDADLTENENPGECPINWAGMVLTEAIVTAPAETEAPATEAPAETPADTAAPSTLDTALLVSFAGLALSTGLIAVCKGKKRK